MHGRYPLVARTWFESPHDSAFFQGPEWAACEELIQAFENALLSGERPAIAEYLKVEGPGRRALLLELIHVDLEFRLKGTHQACVESYLEVHSELQMTATRCWNSSRPNIPYDNAIKGRWSSTSTGGASRSTLMIC